MMSVFGGISRAPVAVMLMVAEMTGDIGLVAPAMVAVAIAWFIVGRANDSIYRSQLPTRAESPAGRLRVGLPLLAALRVADVASSPKLILREDAPVGQAMESLDGLGLPGAPVVDARGSYIGTADRSRVEAAAQARPDSKVHGVVDPTTATVAATADMEVGLEALVQAGGGWVPVTSGDRQVVGILSASDLIGGYHRALDAYSGYVYNVTPHAVVVEERVGRGSLVAGRKIRDAALPPWCVVVTVQHRGTVIYARGSTEIAEGDIVSALVSAERVGELRSLLLGETAPAPRSEGGQLMV
jgi:CBS domain-containing protein